MKHIYLYNYIFVCLDTNKFLITLRNFLTAYVNLYTRDLFIRCESIEEFVDQPVNWLLL
jgi:hypothetical protein